MLVEATVEKNSKRIAIEFKKVSTSNGDKVFDFKAQALDQDGTYGLEGEVHTGEAKFFLAELLSAAAAGFADSSVKRTTNALGNQQEEQSFDTQEKKSNRERTQQIRRTLRREVKADNGVRNRRWTTTREGDCR